MVSLVVGRNSYGTLAEADAHLDGSVTAALTWSATPEETKARSMISAFRQIEKQSFAGTATGVTLLDGVALGVGGTGYAVGDVLTVSGGTLGEAAQAKVLTVDGSGVVLTIDLIHAGAYTAAPTSPAVTTGGGGSGATLSFTEIDQLADFPRDGLVDCDGDEVDSTTYPTDLKAGQFELAYALSQDASIEQASGTGSNVKRLKAGSAEIEYFRPESDAQRFPTQVQEYLACFLSTVAGGRLALGFHSGAGVVSNFENYPDDYDRTEGF